MSLKDFTRSDIKDHVDEYGEEYVFSNGTTINVLYQIPGAPCDNYEGYCDVFFMCRAVDSNGPLSRLKDAILNPELYSDIATWIQVIQIDLNALDWSVTSSSNQLPCWL